MLPQRWTRLFRIDGGMRSYILCTSFVLPSYTLASLCFHRWRAPLLTPNAKYRTYTKRSSLYYQHVSCKSFKSFSISLYDCNGDMTGLPGLNIRNHARLSCVYPTDYFTLCPIYKIRCRFFCHSSSLFVFGIECTEHLCYNEFYHIQRRN